MPTGAKQLGAEFRVNTEITSTQRNPSVTDLADGGYVVTWETLDQDGSNFGIYGQRYDANGALVGGEFQVNNYITSTQYQPSITGLADGGFVVTWSSYQQDGDSYGVYGQRYDVNGALVGTEFHVSDQETSAQYKSSITGLADGGFVVTWESYDQDGDNYGIFGQRYDVNGALVGTEFQVNNYTTSYQRSSSVTALTDGGFVVTWHSGGQDGDSTGIFSQRYDAAGAVVGPQSQINTYITSDQLDPSVAALADGGFVVTWQSLDQDGAGYGIFAQQYEASGALLGAEFQVNTYTTSTQISPSVTGLADGGFVVTWTSLGQDTDNNGIFGQRYDAAGASVGGEFQVNTYFTSSQSSSSVTALTDGGFVVTWKSTGQDGDDDGVYGQQYAARLFGTAGEDIVIDTVGANWLHGQDGADILKGRSGQDIIIGGKGDDKLFGGQGGDTLSGQNGVDVLKGGNGNDVLDGGRGIDSLVGGGGRDKFVFMDSYGRDKITDFQDDIDTLRLDEALWGGGMTKQQVIDTYASVDGGDIVFDFGADELRLKGFTDLTELKDDMAFI